MTTAPAETELEPKIYGVLETIDPEFARLLLGNKLHNRLIRSRKRAQFANDMRCGNWRATGEAIKVTKDGNVVDGEHRLLAVVDSGATIESMVIYNVKEEDRIVMDSGSARTLADHLRMTGVKRSNELAAALAVLWDRRNGKAQSTGRNGGIARWQYVELLGEHPTLPDSVAAVAQVRRRLRVPVGVAAALHYDMLAIDPADTAYFWGRLDDGVDLGEKSPIRALRRKLQENAASRSTALDVVTLHACLIKTWNFYRQGREVNHIFWRRGGAQPELFPELI
jgi:hypothetical protein